VIGLTANLVLLALYTAAGAHIDNAGAKSRLYWVLGGAARSSAEAAAGKSGVARSSDGRWCRSSSLLSWGD
jgi:hypothetical protein